MSSVAGRLRARPRDRTDGYAFCPEDGYWFRPSFTEGKCPLCGEVAPDGAVPPSLMNRSWLGTAGLALLSLVMLALVLFMYFR